MFLKHGLLFFTMLFFNGCTLSNPFVPTSSYGGTVLETYSPSYEQEPIASENMYKATMRPYKVSGITYCPTSVTEGETFRGIASWYGPNFHGERTSNGEYYNMYAYTAAHKTLPINTKVKVTNLKNGRFVIVRINDRGPFVKNRIIDLSFQAAHDLGLIKHGTAPVELEVISCDYTANKYALKKSPLQTVPKTVQKLQPQSNPSQEVMENQNIFSVQVASFSDKTKALKFKTTCYNQLSSEHPVYLKQKRIQNKTIYRVLIGKFKSIEEAKDFIAENAYDEAFVIRN